MSTPIEPYACSLGTVIAHEIASYTIVTADGRTIGIQANGEPSEENVEADIATPPAILATADQIKAEAQRRILILAPSWKQANMIAHTVELVRDNGTTVSAWPPEAQAANAAYQAIWTVIKAIRAHSNTLEANPPALVDLPTAGWPS